MIKEGQDWGTVSAGLFFVTLISPEVTGLGGTHGKHDLELGVHLCQLHLMARDSVALLTVMVFLSDTVRTRIVLSSSCCNKFPQT